MPRDEDVTHRSQQTALHLERNKGLIASLFSLRFGRQRDGKPGKPQPELHVRRRCP